MRRRAAARGQDALSDRHAVKVVGRGFEPHQNHAVAAGHPRGRFVRVEHDPANGRTGGCVQAARGRGARRRAPQSRSGPQQLLDLCGLDAQRASRFVIRPSRTMSTAIFTAAAAVRFAERVWSMNRRPRSIVNSRSCTSR